MKKLKLQTATGVMQIIAKGGLEVTTKYLGIPEDDVKTVTGSAPWTGAERLQVRRVLDSYIYGMLDVLGLPRFEVPAEYAAAIIAVFVHPVNWFAACSWVTGMASQEELVSGVRGQAVDGFEIVTARELFAIVIECATDADAVAQSYATKTGAVIERLAFTGESGTNG